MIEISLIQADKFRVSSHLCIGECTLFDEIGEERK